MSEPIKICIQRAETRKEWDEMQADYIQRAIASAARIEELGAELHSCFHRIEELQAALREIDRTFDNFTNMSYAMFTQAVRNIARKALEGKDD